MYVNYNYYYFFLGPTEPTGITVNYTSPTELTVVWGPPLKPNGVLHSYRITLTPIKAYYTDVEAKATCAPNKNSESEKPLKKPVIPNESKVDRSKNCSVVNNFITRIGMDLSKVTEQIEQCCTACMKRENHVQTPEEAFSAKGFEDYLIDKIFVRRKNNEKNTTLSSRTKRETKNETVPSENKEKPGVIHKTVIVHNGSLEIQSVTFANLTHFTDYEISISACNTPRSNNTAEYCSDVENGGKIRRKTEAIRKFIL